MRFILLLLACAACAPCAAEVYRCQQDGKTVFTDHPCDAAAQPLQTAPAATISTPSAGEAAMSRQYEKDEAAQEKANAAAAKKFRKDYDARKALETQVQAGIQQGEAVKGMTPEQVRQVWGTPDEVDAKGGEERWTYRNGRERRAVTFRGGAVTAVSKGKNRK